MRIVPDRSVISRSARQVRALRALRLVALRPWPGLVGRMELHKWQQVASDGSVRALKYSFGMGTANTLAARLDDGTWCVVSPCVGAPPELLEQLARDGDVSALVANNGFHHLGQATWRRRFPGAVSYAAAGSIARLAKKCAGVEFQPLPALSAKLPQRIRFYEPAGMKAPDLLARLNVSEGAIWFTGDLISNTTAADLPTVFRIIMSAVGGGPGYRLNPIPAIMYLKERPSWRAAVRQLFDEAPIASILPAHGDLITADATERTRALFA